MNTNRKYNRRSSKNRNATVRTNKKRRPRRRTNIRRKRTNKKLYGGSRPSSAPSERQTPPVSQPREGRRRSLHSAEEVIENVRGMLGKTSQSKNDKEEEAKITDAKNSRDDIIKKYEEQKGELQKEVIDPNTYLISVFEELEEKGSP